MFARFVCCFLVASVVWFAEDFVSLAAEPQPTGAQGTANSLNEKLEQVLDSTADLDLDKATLPDVQKLLGKKYGISIYIDRKSLEEANVALDTPLTLHVTGVSLRSALRSLLRGLDLKWLPRDGMLWITTKDVADDLVETRVYPVLDLIVAPDADPLDSGRYDFYSIIDLLANTVRPDSWPAGSGPAPIGRMRDVGAIVVTQTYETHEQIVETLAMLRKARDQQFSNGKIKPFAERSWQPVLSKAADVPAVRKALADRFDFDYDKVPLKAVVDFIANKWNISVLIDRPALAEANIPEDTPVSLVAKGCRLETGLDLLLQPHELDWSVTGDILWITTKDVASDLTSIRIYPVSDLDERDEVQWNNRRMSQASSLRVAIMSGASPDSWNTSGGPGALEYFANARALVVAQTEKVHQEIEKLLAALRQVRAQQFPNQPQPAEVDINDETLHLKVYRVAFMYRTPGGGMGGMGGGGGGFFFVADEAQKQPEPIVSPRQFSPPVTPVPAPQQPAPPQVASPPPFDPTEDLVRIIPQVIEPGSWKDARGKGSIHSLPSRLIVLQTSRVHAQIAKFLRDLQ